jgi:hypothetical protein
MKGNELPVPILVKSDWVYQESHLLLLVGRAQDVAAPPLGAVHSARQGAGSHADREQ